VALVRNDDAALDRLGGGRPPSVRALPPGWRAVAVGAAEVTGPPGALAALVQVSARPPAGDASYLIPVQVHLESSQDGLLVRHVGADGSAKPPPSRPG
jgi:hypothetical protein